jgi:hypothetical protein
MSAHSWQTQLAFGGIAKASSKPNRTAPDALPPDCEAEASGSGAIRRAGIGR